MALPLDTYHFLCGTSLEPGPSRARYFTRDMLLLTTTARERAWRLLKITGPLIGWLDGDSPIPGVSPWLAPALLVYRVHRGSSAYIRAALFVFEIRTVRWHRSSSSIAKVWCVKSCIMLYKDNSRVETAMKATMRHASCFFDVRCFWSQLAMLPFSSFAFGVLWIFFWKAMSIKPWTV